MKKFLYLPHRICESTCFIKGLEDILEWKGSKYHDYLLPADLPGEYELAKKGFIFMAF